MIVVGKPIEVTKEELVFITPRSSATIGELVWSDKVSSDEWGV